MICIGCGCDEHHACTLPGGAACAWIHAGPQGLAGICSACIELYPPSSIGPELNQAEASISIAMSDDEDAEPPAISFLEPRGRPWLDDARDQLDARTRDLDTREISLVDPARADPGCGLILPGDPEFHL